MNMNAFLHAYILYFCNEAARQHVHAMSCQILAIKGCVRVPTGSKKWCKGEFRWCEGGKSVKNVNAHMLYMFWRFAWRLVCIMCM